MAESPRGAVNYCAEHPSPIGSVLSAGLKKTGRGVAEVERAMEDAGQRLTGKMERNVKPLAGIANVSTLLGLMGTVTGMIEVFDVLALSGTGNARSMAAGVSRATIPTMAGMVGALSGVFAATLLSRTAKREVERLNDSLTMDH